MRGLEGYCFWCGKWQSLPFFRAICRPCYESRPAGRQLGAAFREEEGQRVLSGVFNPHVVRAGTAGAARAPSRLAPAHGAA